MSENIEPSSISFTFGMGKDLKNPFSLGRCGYDTY